MKSWRHITWSKTNEKGRLPATSVHLMCLFLQTHDILLFLCSCIGAVEHHVTPASGMDRGSLSFSLTLTWSSRIQSAEKAESGRRERNKSFLYDWVGWKRCDEWCHEFRPKAGVFPPALGRNSFRQGFFRTVLKLVGFVSFHLPNIIIIKLPTARSYALPLQRFLVINGVRGCGLLQKSTL